MLTPEELKAIRARRESRNLLAALSDIRELLDHIAELEGMVPRWVPEQEVSIDVGEHRTIAYHPFGEAHRDLATQSAKWTGSEWLTSHNERSWAPVYVLEVAAPNLPPPPTKETGQ